MGIEQRASTEISRRTCPGEPSEWTPPKGAGNVGICGHGSVAPAAGRHPQISVLVRLHRMVVCAAILHLTARAPVDTHQAAVLEIEDHVAVGIEDRAVNERVPRVRGGPLQMRRLRKYRGKIHVPVMQHRPVRGNKPHAGTIAEKSRHERIAREPSGWRETRNSLRNRSVEREISRVAPARRCPA